MLPLVVKDFWLMACGSDVPVALPEVVSDQ